MLALAASLTLSLKYFALQAFDASERAQAEESVASVERALATMVEDVDERVIDWSDWDDAVTYARRLQGLARARGQTPAQTGLAWVLGDPRVTSVVVGACRHLW